MIDKEKQYKKAPALQEGEAACKAGELKERTGADPQVIVFNCVRS